MRNARPLVKDIEKRNWHLSTGFVGTPLLAPTLTRFGRTDAAYQLLLQAIGCTWVIPQPSHVFGQAGQLFLLSRRRQHGLSFVEGL